MRTTTLQSSKATSRLWKLFAALLLVWLLIPVGQVSAQTSGSGTAKPCWAYTRPNGVPTLTFFKTETNLVRFNGYRLDGTTILDKSATTGDEIIEGEPINQTTWRAYWTEKDNIDKKQETRVKKVIFDASFGDVHPTSCIKWFENYSELESIEGMQYFNTDLVTDMSHMFYGCSEIKTIDFSHFDTKNVTTMEYMFHSIGNSLVNKSPVILDLSSFNTSKVENMGHMFAGSWYITKLDLRGFDMSNVTNTASMFNSCQGLASIYANDWSNNSTITNSKDMFYYCLSLKGAKGYMYEGTDGIEMANGQTGYFMPTYKNDGKDTYPTVDINIATWTGTVSLNLKNKETFEAPYPFYIDKGTYTRENMPSNWGTVCLPFAIDVANKENNCEFYQLDGINGENITVSQITTTIPAGTPVIVKRTSGTDLKIFSPTEYDSIVTQPVEGTGVNHLVGTFTNQELIKQNCYFIARDKFWQVTAKDAEGNTIKGVYVPPFRASITAAEGETLAQSLGIVIADETNGIGLTPTVEDLLSEKAEYFDLQGRRLDGPQKGINIVRMGGKTRKVVIK